MLKLIWFLKREKKLNRIDHKKLQVDFHSEKTFKQILVRECVRCDRNGHRFSLVIFEVVEKTREAFEKLVRILHNRQKRLCDEYGWYNDRHIAVILCDTDRQSALCFAEDIREKASSNGQSVKFAVYEYPDNWQDIYSRSGSLQKPHFNGSIKKSEIKNPDRSRFYAGKDERRSPEVFSVLRNNQDLDHSIPAIKIPGSFNCGTPALKRVIDVIGSLAGLVLLLPLVVLLSLVIKIVSPGGPVFIKEERVGFLGKRVALWRFRTMNACNDDRKKSSTSPGC
ncbi:MAG: sugar transferase [Candidatus Scalindua sp.]|nr:sugar transferase [Candidatus Scalindua sp.]